MKLKDLVAEITPEDDRRIEKRMAVASKIYMALKSKGITQKELATRMKKTESEISECVSGERNMTIDTLSDFEEALGINLLNANSENTKIIPTISVLRVHLSVKNTCQIANSIRYNMQSLKNNNHGDKLLS